MKIGKNEIIQFSIGGVAVLAAILGCFNFYNVKKGSEESRTWMSKIDDEKYISEISIPGSHDSGATLSIADFAGKCQDASIYNQLTYGVRFLDIRLQMNGDEFDVVHSFVDQQLTFNSVLKDCQTFLDENPSETILMSIKRDAGTSEGFGSKLNEIIENNVYFYTETSIPKLKDVRKKIVLLARYESGFTGINMYDGWRDGGTAGEKCIFDMDRGDYTIHVQDHYTLTNPEEKWVEAEETLAFAETTVASTLNINFFSGCLEKSFPISYSVPVAKYMNQKLKENISKYRNVGIIPLDFVSEELASAIYGRNF